MKLYEPVIDEATGNIKIETELTPEEIKQLLSTAIAMCLYHGVAPHSIAHHFQPGGEYGPPPMVIEESPENVEEVQQQPQQPQPVVKTIEQATEDERLQFLKNVDPSKLPQA